MKDLGIVGTKEASQPIEDTKPQKNIVVIEEGATKKPTKVNQVPCRRNHLSKVVLTKAPIQVACQALMHLNHQI